VTTYRVPVADGMLTRADAWLGVPRFALLSVDGPWQGHPGVMICTFSDDDAPAELEGKLVDPTISSFTDGPPRVTARPVVAE